MTVGQRTRDLAALWRREPITERRSPITLWYIHYILPIPCLITAPQRHVRAHCTLIMLGGNDSNNDNVNLANVKLPPPPTNEDVLAFEWHDAAGPTREDFTVNYLGPVNSSWNRTAARVFRESFTASRLYPTFAPLDIKNGFLTYLEGTLRNRYRREIGDVDSDDETMRCARSSRNSRLRTV